MSSGENLRYVSTQQVEEIRLQMLKFAMLQLKDPDLAEDVVQETFVSAYKNANSFKGKSALKTWIFAILKNKIIDLIHYKKRTVAVSEILDCDEDHNNYFDQEDHWDTSYFEPTEWKGIKQAVYQKEFWAIFEACLTKLPAQQARVFMMREYLDFDSQEICNECEISQSNLHVMLYRARLQLQTCLTNSWFERKK